MKFSTMKFNYLNLKAFQKLVHPTAQIKLDGCRALAYFTNDCSMLFSPQDNIINSVPTILKQLDGIFSLYKEQLKNNFCLDGEIYNHNWKLQDIHGALNRVNNYHPQESDLNYYIFDCFFYKKDDLDIVEKDKYCMRRLYRDTIVEDIAIHTYFRQVASNIFILKDFFIHSYQDVLDFTKNALDEGYEGSIIRSHTNIYTRGKRVSTALKFKPHQTMKCLIVKINQAIDKNGVALNRAGSFYCKTDEDVFFTVGSSQFTHAQLEYIWKKHKTLVGFELGIRYQRLTKRHAPMESVAVEIPALELFTTNVKK